MDTTRRYPRSMREAFRNWPENCMGVEKPIPVGARPAWLAGLHDFVSIYRQYRRHHGIAYSLRIAYGCAVKGYPF